MQTDLHDMDTSITSTWGSTDADGAVVIPAAVKAVAISKGNGADMEEDEARSEVSSEHPEDLFVDLSEALDEVESTGTYASCGPLNALNPDLWVHDVGPIDLPLSDAHAKKIIDKARQAPFGKGSETIVDISVRNTWELDPAQFDLRSPGWGDFISALCLRVATDLGIRGGYIHAELYKMLLYEPGAMFKPHTDTEKIPKMFGTLVISLPSRHEGGDVVVKHCGDKKVFKTSMFEQSYLSWYSDVVHEVLPVTSGYRWVLTYNLAMLADVQPSAGLLRHQTRKLRHALEKWVSSEEPTHLYYGLDHQYTEAFISVDALKLRDLKLVQTLQMLTSEIRFDIFFALLEKREMGACRDNFENHGWQGYDEESEEEDDYHSIDEVYETDFCIKKLSDLQGRGLAAGLDFDVENLLQDDFWGTDADEEEFEGFMGNSGPTATHFYRVTAVLLVPRGQVSSYLSAADPTTAAAYFARQCCDPSSSEAFQAVKDICEMIVKESGGFECVQVEIVQEILESVIRTEDWDFFKSITARLQGNIPVGFFGNVGSWIQERRLTFDKVEMGLFNAATSYSRLRDQGAAILWLLLGNSREESVCSWGRRVLARGLDSASSLRLGNDDGSTLVRIGTALYGLGDEFKTKIIQFVEQHISRTSFVLGALGEMHKPAFNIEGSTELWVRLARMAIEHMDVSLLRTPETPAKVPRYSSAYTTEPGHSESPLMIVDHQTLSFFISALLDHRNEDLVQSFCHALARGANRVDGNMFAALWLPFIYSFLHILRTRNITPYTPSYQQFFVTVFEAYLTQYVGNEPSKISSLVRPRVACSCGDCGQLNHFLVDGHRSVAGFSVNAKRRAHLHNKLSHHDCSHVTEEVGSPYTLVVTKTNKLPARRFEAWMYRKQQATTQLASFEEFDLLVLLGADHERITNMRGLVATKAPEISVTQQPAPAAALPRIITPTSGNRGTPAAIEAPSAVQLQSGMKRKLEAEVIDLTDLN